ncbi:MAG: hypothetical protein AAB368_00295, partial [bacterium]
MALVLVTIRAYVTGFEGAGLAGLCVFVTATLTAVKMKPSGGLAASAVPQDSTLRAHPTLFTGPLKHAAAVLPTVTVTLAPGASVTAPVQLSTSPAWVNASPAEFV